jgi:hypothetical protein
VAAQEITSPLSFSAYAGFATYDMAKIKNLNTLNEKSLPFEVKSVNNFDPGIYFGGSIDHRVSGYASIGLFYQHYSTGSRVGQKDYSGVYTYDQILNCNVAGISPEIILSEKKGYSISVSVGVGALFTTFKMREYLKAGVTEQEDDAKFSAFSIVVCPSLRVSVPVIDRLSCFASVGGMIDTGGKVHVAGNKDAVLIIENEKLKTGWSGLRVTAGLTVKLFKL